MVALSAVSGRLLWRKVVAERVMYIQCGLQHSSQRAPVCLLVSKSLLMAVNGTTGQWSPGASRRSAVGWYREECVYTLNRGAGIIT